MTHEVIDYNAASGFYTIRSAPPLGAAYLSDETTATLEQRMQDVIENPEEYEHYWPCNGAEP